MYYYLNCYSRLKLELKRETVLEVKGSLLDSAGRIIPECLLSLIVEGMLELGLYMQSACLIIKRLRAGCIAVPACRGRLIKILSHRAHSSSAGSLLLFSATL